MSTDVLYIYAKNDMCVLNYFSPIKGWLDTNHWQSTIDKIYRTTMAWEVFYMWPNLLKFGQILHFHQCFTQQEFCAIRYVHTYITVQLYIYYCTAAVNSLPNFEIAFSPMFHPARVLCYTVCTYITVQLRCNFYKVMSAHVLHKSHVALKYITCELIHYSLLQNAYVHSCFYISQ